jgi:cyclopropane fatty-acyl-phospholipid synthase-like methyltransferase
MNWIQKFKNGLRGLKQRWGTPGIKRALWNSEFGEGRWDYIEHTTGDIIYSYLARYTRNGSILDLGCGSGNTGCELAAEYYREYTGVDISDVAIKKARQRSQAAGRSAKNEYFQCDIMTFVPRQLYDVILFRESIAYIPRAKVPALLARYAKYLNPEGVFIVRWSNPRQGEEIMEHAEGAYRLVERHTTPDGSGPFLAIMEWSPVPREA